MALASKQLRTAQHSSRQQAAPCCSCRPLPAAAAPVLALAAGQRRRGCSIRCAAATEQAASDQKTVIVKTQPGDIPFPWSEKDPYRLPVSIERVQKMLITNGWEKAWVEQIVDRIMKGMLKTTEERAGAVVRYLTGLGLKQDEVCNMASISVVLLGLNPDTRLRPVVEYLTSRGVTAECVPDLLLRHPRIFEYKVQQDSKTLTKGKARMQIDVLPMPDGTKAAGVSYFREGASFFGSPVSPMGPVSQ